MKYLYYVYQLIVGLPVVIFGTIITALTVAIGCALGNGHFWAISLVTSGVRQLSAHCCCP